MSELFKMESRQMPRFLLPLLALFLLASLIHFVHNAEFLSDYPGLPKTWTRGGVYAVWLAIAAIAICGFVFVRLGWQKSGLALIACAALGGFDSIGHYIVAPMSAHNVAMNATIFFDVACASILLAYSVRHCFQRVAPT